MSHFLHIPIGHNLSPTTSNQLGANCRSHFHQIVDSTTCTHLRMEHFSRSSSPVYLVKPYSSQTPKLPRWPRPFPKWTVTSWHEQPTATRTPTADLLKSNLKQFSWIQYLWRSTNRMDKHKASMMPALRSRSAWSLGNGSKPLNLQIWTYCNSLAICAKTNNSDRDAIYCSFAENILKSRNLLHIWGISFDQCHIWRPFSIVEDLNFLLVPICTS